MANKNCQSVIECNPKVYGSNFFLQIPVLLTISWSWV